MRSITLGLCALLVLVSLVACGRPRDLIAAQDAREVSPPSSAAPPSSVEWAEDVEPTGSIVEEGPVSREDVGAYEGLGTWVDIYDIEVWAHPAAAVRAMQARGVSTAYLQTSNFSRNQPFIHREGVEAFLDAAARHDIRVVAWYLPGFRDVETDLRRTIAAIRLETARGNRFDSFALDIESPEVRRPRIRTARLLNLSARIRTAVGPEYPLGAIVPSPRGVRHATWYWPTFPWRRLARTYDVFLPMTYFTWRVQGRDGAAWYTGQNVKIIRQETEGMRVPIHVIGGISFEASGPETRGFVDTLNARGAIGGSYYTFPGTTRDQWDALRELDPERGP